MRIRQSTVEVEVGASGIVGCALKQEDWVQQMIVHFWIAPLTSHQIYCHKPVPVGLPLLVALVSHVTLPFVRHIWYACLVDWFCSIH